MMQDEGFDISVSFRTVKISKLVSTPLPRTSSFFHQATAWISGNLRVLTPM